MNQEKTTIVKQPNKKRMYRLIYILLFVLALYLIFTLLFPDRDVVQIKMPEANDLISNFLESQDTMQLKEQYLAYYIDRRQFEAMKTIYSGYSDELMGFHLDFGLSNVGGTQYLIAKGITIEDRVLENMIYRTTLGIAGLCPPFCDVTRPLLVDDIVDFTSIIPELNSNDATDIKTAAILTEWYKSREIYTYDIVKSIRVSIEQYRIVEKILNDYPEAKGIGFFMGSIGEGNNESIEFDEAIVILIFAVDGDRNILSLKIIPFTSTKHAGLCPRFCD